VAVFPPQSVLIGFDGNKSGETLGLESKPQAWRKVIAACCQLYDSPWAA